MFKGIIAIIAKLSTAAKLKSFFIGISLLFAIFTLGRIFWQFHLFDFNIYYVATQDAIAGRPLYHNPSIDNNYPPSALLFILPFTLVSHDVAEKIWTVLSTGLLLGSIIVLLRSINRCSLSNCLVVFSLAMWTFPIKFSFGLGQINFLLLFFYALSFAASLKRQDAAAGMWLGLAAAIKLTPLLLLVSFWKKQRWQAVLMTIFSFLFLQLVALWAFSPSNTLEYVTQVLPHIPTVGNAAYYNQALTGLLARIGVNNVVAWWLNYATLGLLLALVWRLIKPSSTVPVHQLMEFGSLITVSLLGAGLAWQHHFIWLLLPLVGVYFAQSKPALKHSLWFWMAIGLMGSNIKQPENFSHWPLLLSHVGIGASLLLCLLIRELKLSPEKPVLKTLRTPFS